MARSTVRRRRQILTSVGAAVVLAGVGVVVANLGGGTGESDVVATTAAKVRMMNQANSTGAYPAALLTGTLIVTDNQCLAVHIPAPEPLTYNVFWPAGFTAERDPSGTAVLYDDTRHQVATEGDTVYITGGLMPESATYPEPGHADLPEADHPCAVGDIWLAAPNIETTPYE